MLALLIPGVGMGGGGIPLEGRNATPEHAGAGGVRDTPHSAGAVGVRGTPGTAGAVP
jgi:hypothetical protein